MTGLNLSTKKNNFITACLIMTFFFLLVFTPSYGQRQVPKNLQKYDQQWIHFGFLIGLNFADFVVKKTPKFDNLDSLYRVESSSQPGFHLGVISNLRLGEHFDLRFVPDLAFSQRDLNYTFFKRDSTYETITKTVESTYIDFPLLLKFKSSRVNNYRVYVMGGLKYSMDMASQWKVKDTPTKQIVKLWRNNYCYEFGVGLDCYMEYFKFSPEIKVSYTLNDLLVIDTGQYTTALDKLLSQLIYINFTFE